MDRRTPPTSPRTDADVPTSPTLTPGEKDNDNDEPEGKEQESKEDGEVSAGYSTPPFGPERPPEMRFLFFFLLWFSGLNVRAIIYIIIS